MDYNREYRYDIIININIYHYENTMSDQPPNYSFDRFSPSPPFSGTPSTTTKTLGGTCFHQVKMPTKEAKEDDAHDATQDTNEDHHALAKKKKLSSELMEVFSFDKSESKVTNFAMENVG